MSEAKPFQLDPNESRKVGYIPQKQIDYYALRLHVIAGDLSANQLKAVAEVAEKYGRGEVHISTRQGMEIHFVHASNLDTARLELDAAGIKMGACGPRVRIVMGCPGSATCKFGIIETKAIAKELDRRYFRTDTPYKFKMSVTGCSHNCAKATENDLGVMGGLLPAWDKNICIDCNLCVNICPTKAISKQEVNGKSEYVLEESACINCSVCTLSCPVNSWTASKSGYTLLIGGTLGKIPRLASVLKKYIPTEEELFNLVERSIDFYRKNGRKKERFGHTLDRLGLETVKKEILGE